MRSNVFGGFFAALIIASEYLQSFIQPFANMFNFKRPNFDDFWTIMGTTKFSFYGTGKTCIQKNINKY